MKILSFDASVVILVIGLCGSLVARLEAQPSGSLSDLDSEYRVLTATLEKVLVENKQLRDALSETQKTLSDMRVNLAAASGESEIFKRHAAELKLRIEALGLSEGGDSDSRLQQRLIAAVNDLRVAEEDRRRLSSALIRLSEASSLYASAAVGVSPATRMMLEGELRNATAALGLKSRTSVEAKPVPSTMSEALAISVKEDLALVVLNLGSQQGVRVGMPFQVFRGNNLVGTVRVIDVREKISGAVIQNLKSEKERVIVGDRLRIETQ